MTRPLSRMMFARGTVAALALVATAGIAAAETKLKVGHVFAADHPWQIALNGLARDADLFVTITEAEAQQGASDLAALGLATTPSGGAGIAALIAGLSLPSDAQVLAILSEGPEDV